MKESLKELLAKAVEKSGLQGAEETDEADEGGIHIENTRNPRHGDFASNLALVLAKQGKQTKPNPRALAEKLVAALPPSPLVAKVEIAGPGFINFFISPDAWRDGIDRIRAAGEKYGTGDAGGGRKVLVEFVSANPTGPLHVGHGRGAAYGDAVARLLAAAGWRVEREYYVNDAGRQMDILALSVWLRYLELCKCSGVEFPANGYLGDYIRALAADLHSAHGDKFTADAKALCASLPEDAEARLDELIRRCKAALGAPAYATVHALGRDAMVEDIRLDLGEFGVHFDRWAPEHELLESGAVERALDTLTRGGHIYEKDGAVWFRATDFGDEKDRAVRRADGSYTYFAADIAYHLHKGERGYDILLNVLGADHHGYAGRIKASFQALGHCRDKLQVRLVQFAVLYRSGKKIQMSTRGGEFVTLRELREEVGNDAARFFYVSRRNDQHMDFDLDLAKTQSADNPVYYIQYAHARIYSVFKKLPEGDVPTASGGDAWNADYALLVEPEEFGLMQTMSRFPEVVEQAAGGFAPHLVAYYLRDLATDFHAYYNAHPFLSGEPALRRARLGLIDAVRQVLANGLGLLGVSAPEKM